MHTKLALAVAVAAVVCAMGLPRARADEWNQEVEIRFSQPVEVPGQVLPAGTYWFKLANSETNRNIVEIFNHDYSKLEATLITDPQSRREPTARTEVSFAERSHHRPEALLGWFYPGALTGHQFIYPHQEAQRLQLDAKQNLLLPRIGSSQPDVVQAQPGL